MEMTDSAPTAGGGIHDASFATHDGVILRGRLYVPAAASARPVPGVVMSHGFSATIGMGLGDHAEALAAEGFAVLLYDHRSLGSSDGEPRRLVDPFVQARDMMAAIGWLAAQPAVDAGRIGLWGTSYSGAQALVLAALDPRVRAVATIVPAVGRPGAVAGDDAWEALAARISGASVDADAAVGPRAVVPGPGALPVALMPDPDTAAWMLAEGAATGGLWRNEVFTPAWGAGNPPFDPAPALKHLRAPVLILAGDRDAVAPAADARLAAELAGDRAEFVMLEGHHCSFYAGEPGRCAARAVTAFYRRTLAEPAGGRATA